jgi:hypothetical protein
MEKTRHNNKIEGWLWLPAIALMIQPLSFFASILPFFKNPGPNIHLTINGLVLIGDIVLLSMVAIVAWFYFNKKKIAPALYILKIIIMVLMWEIMDGLIESQKDPPFIGMMFHCLVIIPYLVLSERVKVTFVEELNSAVKIEKIFMRLSPVLLSFYLKIRKMRFLVFVLVLLFLCFTIILNCAIRSLRVDGDLMHTFNYLI